MWCLLAQFPLRLRDELLRPRVDSPCVRVRLRVLADLSRFEALHITKEGAAYAHVDLPPHWATCACRIPGMPAMSLGTFTLGDMLANAR